VSRRSARHARSASVAVARCGLSMKATTQSGGATGGQTAAGGEAAQHSEKLWAPGKFEHGMLLFAAHRTFWTLSWDMEHVFVADRDFVPGVSTRAILRRYLKECLILWKPQEASSSDWLDVLATLAGCLADLWPVAHPKFELPCFTGRGDFA